MTALNLLELPTLEDLAPTHLKMLIHGDPNSGKTTLAASIAELGKTLFVTLPGSRGMRSIAKVPYAKNIVPAYPENVTEVTDIFMELQSDPADFYAVVVEGLRAWHTMYVRYYDGLDESTVRTKKRGKDAAKKRDGRQLYGEANDALKDDVLFWYGLADANRPKPLHVVMTSESRPRETFKESGIYRIGPDVSPGALRTVEAIPDWIAHTAIEAKEGGDLESLTSTAETEYVYTVRFGPHDEIMTKLREDVDSAKKWPAVVGRDGKRLTIPKFMKFMDLTT